MPQKLGAFSLQDVFVDFDVQENDDTEGQDADQKEPYPVHDAGIGGVSSERGQSNVVFAVFKCHVSFEELGCVDHD